MEETLLNTYLLIAALVLLIALIVLAVTYICWKNNCISCNTDSDGERDLLLPPKNGDSRSLPENKHSTSQRQETVVDMHTGDEQSIGSYRSLELEQNVKKYTESDMSELKSANKTLEEKCNESTKHAEKIKKQNKENERKQDELKEEYDKLKIQLDNIKKEYESLKKQLENIEKEPPKDDIPDQTLQVKQLTEECDNLKIQLEQAKEALQNCEKEKEVFQRQMLKKATLYIAKGAGEYGTAIDDILKLLKKDIGEKVDLTVTDWKQGTTIGAGDVILLFCLTASRLGTDVAAAFTNNQVKGGKTTSLVILHHKRKDQSVTSSLELLDQPTKEQFKIETAVDCYYHKDAGLHDIAPNNKSVEEIANFVKMCAIPLE